MPSYPSHAAAPGTPAGSTVELDDTPGCLLDIPTEHLCDSPQGRHVARRRMRMLMAFDLFTAMHTGSLTYCGNTTDLRAWCWRQADLFIGEADNPPTSPTPPVAPAAVKLHEIDDAA